MENTKRKKEQTKKSNKKDIKRQKGGQSSGQTSEYDFDTQITEIEVLEIDNPDDITSNTK